jgi:coronin-1B/1C/6
MFSSSFSKVGHVLFHPTADHVLASSSADTTIKLWDTEKATERQTVEGHHEVIQSITWNYNGSLMATTCRDKKVRILDVRANQVIQETDGHQGIKGSRVVWLGEHDRLATTGFARSSDRQLALWDTRNMEKPLKMKSIDSSSGVLMPYYDADVNMLYLAGKVSAIAN